MPSFGSYSNTIVCSSRTPKGASSSLRLPPYLSSSSSPRTTRPPPAATNAWTAAISEGENTGESSPTVRSHLESLGWAITSTSAPASATSSRGRPVVVATAKSRRVSSAAAAA